MKKKILIIVTAILLAAIVKAEEERKKKTGPKPFGLGIGPSYIGGRDSDLEGTQLSLKIYSQYVMFKRMMGMNLVNDEKYYQEYFQRDSCIGSCIGYSYCKKGICVCDHSQSVTQIYGRCFPNATAYFVGNKDKYRKPTPPPLPDWCYCTYTRTDKEGRETTRREICNQHKGIEECTVPTYPDEFDHRNQFCQPNDNSHCLDLDNNFFCSSETVHDPRDNIRKNVCRCRKDMKFDTRNMECRLFIDVDCTSETSEGYDADGEIAKVLRGEKQPSLENNFSQKDVKKYFCNLLDSQSTEYAEHIIGEFTFSILGLSLGGFIAASCIACLTCCCCCKCCEKVRTKIRSLDPRNAMRDAGIGPGAQMAALGAVAAGEYMENKNERGDEARIAAMQGQNMGPPGYAPVPTGPQPGYPPQDQYPQYPPQGQPGYIPPAGGGPGMMNMAPELALAGAGAFTGNAAMTGMGVVAAVEKMDMEEDKEDRFKAAAMKGVPPPPMGYAGGAVPSYPAQQLPPATAAYPRQ